MKATVRVLGVLACAVMVIASVGCAKKCVKPDEPILPPPPPVVEQPVMEKPIGEAMELELQTIHFDFDMSDIRAGDAAKLEDNAAQLKTAAEMEYEPMVTVEGHCDPVGTAEYNMALGQRRAEAAKGFLIKLGVSEAQLSCISFGEEKLVSEMEAEFEQNRRVEFKPVVEE